MTLNTKVEASTTFQQICISFHWDVQIEHVLSLKSSEYIMSPGFDLNGMKLHLAIGRIDKKTNVYVKRVNIELETRILCSTSIKVGTKVIQRKSSDFIKETIYTFYLITFLDTSELSAYMKSDSRNCSSSMTISCTVRSYDDINEVSQSTQTSSSSNNEFENLSKSLGSLLLDEDLSDLKIKVGQREFPAHKIILAARSPVFSSMFKHEMFESISGTIDIEDCDPDSFADFLKFLYTGKLDLVTSFNALNIYKIAHKYELKDLQDECSTRMSNSLTADNICDVLDLSVTHDEKELLETATKFFVEHAKDVFNTEKWLIFLGEKKSLANEFLKEMAEYYSLK